MRTTVNQGPVDLFIARCHGHAAASTAFVASVAVDETGAVLEIACRDGIDVDGGAFALAMVDRTACCPALPKPPPHCPTRFGWCL